MRIDQFDEISICEGIFTDDGDTEGNHSGLASDTITICSNSGAPNESHIRLTFTQFQINGFFTVYNGPTADPATIINTLSAENNNTNPVIEATAANSSGCLTIVFNSGNPAPGWTALISCVRACQPVVANLAGSDPMVMPEDTGYIDVCIGQPITFSGMGLYPEDGIIYDQSDATSTFEWNFDDGNTADGANVGHAYSEAGGYTVQLRITDLIGCRNTNMISQRVRVAPRPSFIEQNPIPDEICVNDLIILEGSTQFDPNPDSEIFVTTSEQSFSASQLLADTTFLPDGLGTEYTTSLEFTNFAPGQLLTDIDDLIGICLNMEHSFAGDLDIWIECPNGQEVDLVQFGALGGQYVGLPVDLDDLEQGIGFDYCWTPDAEFTWAETVDLQNIGGGESIPAGDYRPDEAMSGLLGCPLNGEWTIHVRDNLTIDNGFIFNWGITFADNLFPDLETFTVGFDEALWRPEGELSFYSPDSIAAQPSAAGFAHYTYMVTDEFGCEYDTTVTVEVLPFSHPDCYDCQEILDTNFQAINTVPGTMIQTELASITELDTSITFRTNPNEPFGNTFFPSLAGSFEAPINVNSIFPGSLADLSMQLESVCVTLESQQTGGIRLFLQAPDNTL
ncbi:MAG: PKD domain-containing protein, partial [Bacteroidota bacterium]